MEEILRDIKFMYSEHLTFTEHNTKFHLEINKACGGLHQFCHVPFTVINGGATFQRVTD